MKKRKRWKVKNTKKFHSVFEFWWKNENDEKSKTRRNFNVKMENPISKLVKSWLYRHGVFDFFHGRKMKFVMVQTRCFWFLEKVDFWGPKFNTHRKYYQLGAKMTVFAIYDGISISKNFNESEHFAHVRAHVRWHAHSFDEILRAVREPSTRFARWEGKTQTHTHTHTHYGSSQKSRNTRTTASGVLKIDGRVFKWNERGARFVIQRLLSQCRTLFWFNAWLADSNSWKQSP